VVVLWGRGDKSTYFCGEKEKDFLVKSLRPKYNVAVFPVPLDYTKTPVLSSEK
jgi:hypothetical protein